MFDKLFDLFRQREDARPAYEVALESGDNIGAVRLLQVAVREQDPRAMVTYGTMLLLGEGIEQDSADGLAWIRQAAVRGELRGMMLLGGYLAAGLHVHRSDDEAAYWLWKAATSGLIEAADALSDLVLRSPEVVGVHFCQADFDALLRVMKPARTGH